MPATLVTQYETSDWTPLSVAPNAVTYNGNRSYSLTYPSVDYTSTLTPGQRLRTTRTVAAPTQCTSLNGTNQYYSKTSPAGMTFTDDFVVSAWVKLSSYPAAAGEIASRYNGTSGWEFRVNSTGQVLMIAYSGGSANYSQILSYQSVPLNKWVHITGQLDMSAFTATTTTSYIMIDGVDVPSAVARSGTNPTSLIQAGDLNIGTRNAGADLFFPGKIAQVAIFNAKVTQATIRGYISQGLAGNETSLISAYSFNNSINDLNTSNANNLTAQNSAVATNADSPFGGQAGGTISSTLDYGIIQSRSFSTDTTVVVQVPEGCAIPTSGGVSATSFSGLKIPNGFLADTDKWTILSLQLAQRTFAGAATTWYEAQQLYIPVGNWNRGYKVHSTGTFSSGTCALYAGLGETTAARPEDERLSSLSAAGAITVLFATSVAKAGYSIATAKTNYLNIRVGGNAATSNTLLYPITTGTPELGCYVYAENAYL